MTDTETETLTDRDYKGPDGSRFSNYHLIQNLLDEGALLNAEGEVVTEWPHFWPITEIQVFQDDEYSGSTHEWRFPEGTTVRPWEINDPNQYAVTVYEQGYVYMGPEEGGWGVHPSQAKAVIIVNDPMDTSKEIELGKALAYCLAEHYGERSGVHTYCLLERAVGADHTVGSAYYC